MKKIQKIIAIVIIGFLLVSSIPGDLVGSKPDPGDSGDSPEIRPGVLMIIPESRDLGDLCAGDTNTTSFNMINLDVSDPGNNLIVLDVVWAISIPDMFKNHVTVSPTSGVLTPGKRDSKTGEVIFDENHECNVTVDLDTTGMVRGIYRCDIAVTDEAGLSKYFSLKFSVDIDLNFEFFLRDSDTNRKIVQDPMEDNDAMYDEGFRGGYNLGLIGKNVESVILDIWNRGRGLLLNYSLNLTCQKMRMITGPYGNPASIWESYPSNWVEIDPTCGESSGEHDLININFSTMDLEYEEYKIWVFIDTNYGLRFFSIRFEVGYMLKIRSRSDDFGTLFRGNVTNTSFQVWNKYPGELTWSVFVPPIYRSYINVTPSWGVSTGPDDRTDVTVTVNTSRKYDKAVLPEPFCNQPYGGSIHPRYDLFFHREDLYACRPGSHNDDLYVFGVPGSYNYSNYSAPSQYDLRLPPNIRDFPKFTMRYYLSECDPDESYDMLIITTQYLLDHSHTPCLYDLDDLKQAHEELDGFNVKIMTVEEIYEKYLNADPLYTWHAPKSLNIQILTSTDATENNLAIKEFINDANKNWGAKYVLLVGDDDWVIEEKYVASHDEYAEIEYPATIEEHLLWLWKQYMMNVDTKWIKLANIDDIDLDVSSVDGSVEVPTFQHYVEDFYTPNNYGGYDPDAGRWESFFCPVSTTSEVITVNVQTLYPYLWNSTTNKFYEGPPQNKEDFVPRDLYVDRIVLHNTSLGCADDQGGLGRNIIDEFNFEGDMHPSGRSCGRTNYTNNSGGLTHTFDLTETNGDNDIGGVSIGFYNHHKYGLDTFIVRINGEEYRYYDTPDTTWQNPSKDEETIATDQPYTLGSEVYVGRAPVSDGTELFNFCKKTIEYMNAPAEGGYLNALLLSEYLGYSPEIMFDYSELEIDTDIIIPELMFRYSNKYKEQSVDRINVTDYMGIPTDVCNVIEMHDTPSPESQGILHYVCSWDKEEMMSVVNEGVGIINHMGHGERYGKDSSPVDIDYRKSNGNPYVNPKAAYINMKLRDWMLDEYTIHNVNDGTSRTAGLNNPIKPFVYSLGCYGGFFDNPSGCMAEWMLGDDDGAVAGVWCSAATPVEGAEAFMGIYDQVFWQEIFNNGGVIGEALVKSKEKIGTSCGNLFYGMNLFGDPALRIKGVPEKPPVAKNDYINVSENSKDNIVDVLANDILPEAAGPILAFNPVVCDFGPVGNSVYNTSFEIWNFGKDILEYSLEVQCQKKHNFSGYWSDDSGSWKYIPPTYVWETIPNDWIDWSQINPMSGTSTGEKDTINVIFDTTNLTISNVTLGDYRCIIFISSNSLFNYIPYDFEAEGYYYFELKFKVVNDSVVDPQSENINAGYNLDSMYEISIDPGSVTDPKHGTAIINGTFVEYTPNPDYCGPDSFNYTIYVARDLINGGLDRRFSTATVFVNVSGMNDPPMVGDIPDQTITTDDSFDLIFLDDFVIDSESNDDEIVWSYSGNVNCVVDIVDCVVNISYPVGWNGSEAITFTATDSDGLSESDVATFTVNPIVVNLPPVFSDETPVDGSGGVPVSIDPLNITIKDPEGDSFNWTIESIPPYFYGIGTGEANGTKTACSQIDCCMPYNTTFIWYVNATDSGSSITTSEVYTFTTESNPGLNHPPDKPINPAPLNDSINQSISLSLSVDVFDPDNDNLNVTFYIDDVSVGADNLVISGQSASTDVELEYNTSYSWYAIADDGQYTNQSDTWIFTTKENNTEDPVEEPTVEIIKPLEGMLYVRNELKRNFVMTTTIGDIDIEAVVLDPSGTNVDKVKFFLDEDELKSITYDNQTTTYSYTLDKRAIGVYTLKVSACDSENKEIVRKELDVIIFYFGLKK